MSEQSETNKIFLNIGDHPLCVNDNWLRFPKYFIELKETGVINKSEFLCISFLWGKSNSRTAAFITNNSEISAWLECSEPNTRKVMVNLRSKGFICFKNSQGKHKYIVYINYFPVMKENQNQLQRFSYFTFETQHIAFEANEKYEVDLTSTKNQISELRREFKDSQQDSAKSLDIDQT